MNALYGVSIRAGRPNIDDDRWLTWSVAGFPFFFVAVSLLVKSFTPGLYSWSIREDGFIEWATALGFAAAAVLALAVTSELWRERRTFVASLYAVLAAGMVFAVLEEISWGQRVLDIDSPEYFQQHSTKEEINLHNLEQFPLGPVFIAVALYGTFSRLLAPDALRRRFRAEFELLTPRLPIAIYFLPTLLLYSYFEYHYYTVIRPLGMTIRREFEWGDSFITGKDQEPVELLLAIGFLVFVLDNWQRRKARASDAVNPPVEQGSGRREIRGTGGP